MENKKIILGLAIVFSFIFSTNAQHKRHHQEHQVGHHKTTQHNKTIIRKPTHHHSYHNQYNNYAPVCTTKPVINVRLTHNFQPRKYWIEGYHSYIPRHGYVWNDGYYTSVNRGRVWIPTKFVQRGRHHRFQKIPGHYIYI